MKGRCLNDLDNAGRTVFDLTLFCQCEAELILGLFSSMCLSHSIN